MSLKNLSAFSAEDSSVRAGQANIYYSIYIHTLLSIAF